MIRGPEMHSSRYWNYVFIFTWAICLFLINIYCFDTLFTVVFYTIRTWFLGCRENFNFVCYSFSWARVIANNIVYTVRPKCPQPFFPPTYPGNNKEHAFEQCPRCLFIREQFGVRTLVYLIFERMLGFCERAQKSCNCIFRENRLHNIL